MNSIFQEKVYFSIASWTSWSAYFLLASIKYDIMDCQSRHGGSCRVIAFLSSASPQKTSPAEIRAFQHGLFCGRCLSLKIRCYGYITFTGCPVFPDSNAANTTRIVCIASFPETDGSLSSQMLSMNSSITPVLFRFPNVWSELVFMPSVDR